MRYTLESKISDILDRQEIQPYFSLFVNHFLTDVIPDEYRDCRAMELPEKVMMPWGVPFPADVFIHGANLADDILTNQKYRFYPIWGGDCETFVPNGTLNTKEQVFLATTNTYTSRKKPAVIIVPGGGYAMTSMDGEGVQIAERLESYGYGAFVLYYRVSPNRYPDPQLDLAMAIRYVRKHAEDFGVDPDNVMLLGFSAGGHLVSSYTAAYEEYGQLLMRGLEEADIELVKAYRDVSGRPDKLCTCYAVVSFSEVGHEPSFQELTGADEALRQKLSVENHVHANWPRTFLWTCRTDELVPYENTVLLDAALTKVGIEHETHIYPSGAHGIGLGVGTSAEGWCEDLVRYMEPELAGKELPYEYFAKKIAEDTWLIGCDNADFGERSGKTIEFGMPTGNSWLIVGEEYALLLDSAATLPGLREFAEQIAGKSVRLYLSHAHPDHIYRIGEFDEVSLHGDDMDLLTSGDGMGTFAVPEHLPEEIHDIRDVRELDVGKGHVLQVIHFPGHTDGSVMLYDPSTKLLFSGDSVGRNLLYGDRTYYPYKKYIENLKGLKRLELKGICAAHERRVLDPAIIDFMCEALADLPKADRRVQYTPEMEPLIAMTVGDRAEMLSLDCSFPERIRDKIMAE